MINTFISINLNQLKLTNWNCNGLKQKLSSFTEFLQRYDVPVACVSETHLTPRDRLRIPGYLVYRRDRLADFARGGVAIVVRRDVKHDELPQENFSSLDCIGIRLYINGCPPVNLWAAYLRPADFLAGSDLDIVFASSPSLLLGDLNSKHTMWDCRKTNRNGRILLDKTSNIGAVVLAPEEPTFYPSQMGYTPDILDIAVAKDISISLQQVVLTELDSDHLPVMLTTPEAFQARPPVERLIKGKINWDVFNKYLQEHLLVPSRISSSDSIDEANRRLQEVIYDAVEASTSQNHLHQTRFQRKVLPARIKDLIKEKNWYRRQWQRTKSLQFKLAWNRLRRIVKNQLEEVKIRNYQEFLEDLVPGDRRLWRENKRLLRTHDSIPPINHETGTAITDDEKCEVFANYLELFRRNLQRKHLSSIFPDKP